MTFDATAVLHPVTDAQFFKDIYERKHHHVRRNDASYFRTLISVDDISRYLATHSASHPTVQLVHSEENLSPSQYTDTVRKIDPVALDALFAEGATVVLSQAHQQFEALASLSRGVASQLQMRAQTNVYLSPPGNQGFRSHYDTHDVFILQVSGKKTFRFYPSDVELPFPDDEYDAEQNPHTDVSHEVLLNAGDTLYIPRGLVHDAVAMPDASSLHITLGVFPVIVRDLLQSCIQVAAEQKVALRTTVADTGTTADTESNTETLYEQLRECLTPDNLAEAHSRLLDDIALESVPLCQSLFDHKTLSADSTVSMDHNALFGHERRGDAVKLRTHGQIMSFKEPLSSALEYLLSSGPVRISQIPALSTDQQLALCVHLQHAHVLRVEIT